MTIISSILPIDIGHTHRVVIKLSKMLNISKTERDNEVLSYEGHQYLKRKDRVGISGETFWRCRKVKKNKCASTMKTLGNNILSLPGVHSHLGDSIEVDAKVLQSSIRIKAACSTETTRNILGASLENSDQDVLQRLPKRAILECNIRSIRRKGNPILSAPSSINFEIPDGYSDVVVHDTGFEDENRIIALGHPTLLGALRNAELFLGDGTFDVCPNMFFQLYTIHTKIGNSFPPCVYFLLPNKRFETYERMLVILKSLAPSSAPERILVDFEIAAMLSFQSAFHSAEIKGCFFHLNQSILRKVNELGLKRKYESDGNFNMGVKSLAALAFVPLNDLISIFGNLADTFEDSPATNDLLSYFKNTYVVGPQVGTTNRTARFPPEIWNYYDSTIASTDDTPKTTNSVEGFHNALQGMFTCKHPTVWKLFDGIQRDIGVQRLTMANASVQLPANRRNKYIILAQRLKSKVANYPNEINKMQYLRAIAHMQST